MPLLTLTLNTPVDLSTGTFAPDPEQTTLLWATPSPTIATLITRTIVTSFTPTPTAIAHGWNTWTAAHRAGVVLGGLLGALAIVVMLLCCGWRKKKPPQSPALPTSTSASSYTGSSSAEDKKRYPGDEGGISPPPQQQQQHLAPPRVRGGDGASSGASRRGGSRGGGSLGLLSPRGGSRRGSSRDSKRVPSRRAERRRERASVVQEASEGSGSSSCNGVGSGKALDGENTVRGGFGAPVEKSPAASERAPGGFEVKMPPGFAKAETPPLISPLLISPDLTALEGSGRDVGWGGKETGPDPRLVHGARHSSRASSTKPAGNPVLDRVKRGSRSEAGPGSDSGSVSGVVRL